MIRGKITAAGLVVLGDPGELGPGEIDLELELPSSIAPADPSAAIRTALGEDSLAIWRRVCDSRPGTTRWVDFGRGFTTVQAYAQFQLATYYFGPFGSAWGVRDLVWTTQYRVGSRAETEGYGRDKKTTGVMLEISVTELTGEFFYPTGAFPMADETYFVAGVDEDVRKKLLTGATTKALSFLGFNADVFLNAYQGENKYERPAILPDRLFEKPPPGNTPPPPTRADAPEEKPESEIDPELEEETAAASTPAAASPTSSSGESPAAGQVESEPKPKTLADVPQALKELHAWAKGKWPDEDPHAILHDSLPAGVESLSDLPLKARGDLKQNANLFMERKAS